MRRLFGEPCNINSPWWAEVYEIQLHQCVLIGRFQGPAAAPASAGISDRILPSPAIYTHRMVRLHVKSLKKNKFESYESCWHHSIIRNTINSTYLIFNLLQLNNRVEWNWPEHCFFVIFSTSGAISLPSDLQTMHAKFERKISTFS